MISGERHDKLPETLMKFLTARRLRPEAQGCRALAATQGKDGPKLSNPNGVAPNVTLHKKPRMKRSRRNLFEVGNLCPSIPRVATKARQPWALGRNRFAVKRLNQSVLMFVGHSDSRLICQQVA